MEQSLKEYSESEISKCILAEALISRGKDIFEAMKTVNLSDKIIESCKEGKTTLEEYKKRQYDFI